MRRRQRFPRPLLCGLTAVLLAVASTPGAALAPRGTVKALVIFTRFADESGPEQAPAFAADLFDPRRPGSVSHYFDEMSRGQFRLEGQVLPRLYAAPLNTAAYLSDSQEGRGGFGRFTRDILDQADADVDFGRFDDDGPDGVPNSGDDDGYVDLLLLVTQSTPAGFIAGDADGVALLGLDTSYRTRDASARSDAIRVRADADGPGGTLQRGRGFSDAAGIIAHEIGHLLGLPDLYDRDRQRDGAYDPESDSGGIGYWGLMGHGARGFDDSGGPTPLSAWSLKRLGWLGVGNDQLVVVEGRLDDAFIGDVHAGGDVYQLPLDDDEYLLVEYRRPAGSYYDRQLPGEGVLIWHVDEARQDNDQEQAKLVDVVCADGLYLDAGFPAGQLAAPDDGWDNLDFYAADAAYRQAHAGNLGDATDLFDGVARADYWPLSNPAVNGVSVTRIRPVAGGFAADLRAGDPRRAGPLRSETWRDTVELIGDVFLPPGARVELAPGTVVLAAADGRRGGLDPGRVEVRVAGTLSATGGARFLSAAARPAPGDWQGLFVGASGSLVLASVTVQDAVDAIVAQDAAGLRLSRTTVSAPSGDGLRLVDVSGDVFLTDVVVEGAGGDGAWIEGGGRVRARALTVRGSGGHGLVRADGGLELADGDLADNDAGDLWLREGAFGRVEQTRLRGAGEGVRMDLTGAVTFAGNDLRGYRVALRLRSAAPRLEANVFADVDTVLVTQGFRVPVRMQLNVVETPAVLVVNRTDRRLDATRNWWGTVEPARIAAAMTGPVDWDPPLTLDPRLPVVFELRPNFPNPFNGQTVIEFSVSLLKVSLRAGTAMRLEVRTITGGLVRRLVDTEAAPGFYRVVWDGRDESGRAVASGVYVCELSVDRLQLRRRLTVLR